MTPERDDGGRSPRGEKAESAFRLEKAGRESIEPERRSSVPSWKRAAAKLQKEQATPAEPRGDTEALPQVDTAALDRPVEDGEQEQRNMEPESPRQEASGQSVPKYRQHSRREYTEGSSDNPKFRQSSSQPPPAEKLHRDSTGGGASASTDQPEPDKLRKARQRVEQREGKLNTARGKLEKQSSYI